MGTVPVTNTNASAVTTTERPPVVAKNTLGKDEFLKLLTAQLANQDPLAPVDNQAFIAQLAQFSSVEQLQGLGSRLDTLLLATASQNQMSTANLVGKDVTYKADAVTVTGGKAPPVTVQLDGRAAVTALVQDETGRTVRSISLGSHEAGSFDLGWNGRDDAGNAVPDGKYAVKVAALAPDGTAATAVARATGRVTGVSFDGTSAQLVVSGNPVKLPDVVQISQPAQP